MLFFFFRSRSNFKYIEESRVSRDCSANRTVRTWRCTVTYIYINDFNLASIENHRTNTTCLLTKREIVSRSLDARGLYYLGKNLTRHARSSGKMGELLTADLEKSQHSRVYRMFLTIRKTTFRWRNTTWLPVTDGREFPMDVIQLSLNTISN